MPEPRQLALDSPVPPGRVLPRHPDDQRLDRSAGGRPSWPAPAGVVPLAGNEVTVPAQDRGRGDREDLRPPAAAHQPGQRREPEPVGMVPPQPTTELTVQHLVLVAQHQQLGVLGQVGPGQHREQADQAPHQAVDDRQQHPAMVPATPLILAAKPQLTTRDRVSERDTVGAPTRIRFKAWTPGTRPRTAGDVGPRIIQWASPVRRPGPANVTGESAGRGPVLSDPGLSSRPGPSRPSITLSDAGDQGERAQSRRSVAGSAFPIELSAARRSGCYGSRRSPAGRCRG